MTTSVWDGKTLAADGRVTAGNRISQEDRDKIFLDGVTKLRGSTVICYSLAGAADMVDRVGAWIREGCEVTEDFKDTNFELIIVTEDKAYSYSSESNDLFELQTPDCVGSGYDFAHSALAFKKNAVQAVKHAATLDIYTGGIGTYINCRT